MKTWDLLGLIRKWWEVVGALENRENPQVSRVCPPCWGNYSDLLIGVPTSNYFGPTFSNNLPEISITYNALENNPYLKTWRTTVA